MVFIYLKPDLVKGSMVVLVKRQLIHKAIISKIHKWLNVRPIHYIYLIPAHYPHLAKRAALVIQLHHIPPKRRIANKNSVQASR